MSQSRTRGQKGTEASSESATEPGNPTIHQTRHTPAETRSASRRRTKTGAGTSNTSSRENDKEHANSAVASSVSLSTEIHTTTAFKLHNQEKGNDIASAIQKDLSTKLENITLAHSELTKDGRFFSKTGGFEHRANCHPGTKGSIDTLLSADCKTGECYNDHSSSHCSQ